MPDQPESDQPASGQPASGQPASRPVQVFRFILRSSKRIAVTVIGGVLVVAGLAMLVLPGPGILVVVAGFAVLGTEYAWASAALDRTKSAAETAGRVAKDTAGKAGRAAKGAAKGAADTATSPLRRNKRR